MDDGTFAFIMRDRLTHANIQSNPYAAFLFVEEGKGYRGKRFFLKKVSEVEDAELAGKLSRRCMPDTVSETKFVVFFQVEKELPLIGPGDASS